MKRIIFLLFSCILMVRFSIVSFASMDLNSYGFKYVSASVTSTNSLVINEINIFLSQFNAMDINKRMVFVNNIGSLQLITFSEPITTIEYEALANGNYKIVSINGKTSGINLLGGSSPSGGIHAGYNNTLNSFLSRPTSKYDPSYSVSSINFRYVLTNFMGDVEFVPSSGSPTPPPMNYSITEIRFNNWGTLRAAEKTPPPEPPPSSSEEPSEPPPSSSEEPSNPPNYDIPEIPKGDGEYVVYDTSSWKVFLQSMLNFIATGVNIGFKIFAFLFSIFLTLKIVKGFIGSK